MNPKIKILIIDDSASVRKLLEMIFHQHPNLEVIGTAGDPYEAAEFLKNEVPDVITLDVEMPRMNGITFLRKLMNVRPIPVVVISTLTEKGTDVALQCLEQGATEVLPKPQVSTQETFEESAIELQQKVIAAANVKLPLLQSIRKTLVNTQKVEQLKPAESSKSALRHNLIAMGASTGGTEALKAVLMNMPKNCPGIVITQHMPEVFTLQFAKRLNDLCSIEVREAKSGDRIHPGLALIAPGGKHMLIKKYQEQYFVEIKDGPRVNRHRPSVDVLFKTAARYAGKDAIGVLLTGMGRDGALGLSEMKQTGAYTIAQSEQTSVVFGMPKEAIKLNAHKEILDLDQISNRLIRLTKYKQTLKSTSIK